MQSLYIFSRATLKGGERMTEKGIDYLRKKLDKHVSRVNMRYKQYSMTYRDNERGITIPPEIRARYKSVLGWCAKGVDGLSDRLIFREFTNDEFEVKEIFDENNPDVLFDSAILSALIASCSFIYLSKGESDIPRLQVIEASNATGIIDPITGLLTEGYAVLRKKNDGKADIEAHFLPDRTDYYYEGVIKSEDTVKNNVSYPLLVPIIHRADAVRPFGRSRISRAGIYYQSYAKRTLERADITAEFYSFPQKYVVGLSNDAEPMDNWKATVASMLTFTRSDGEADPKLGQFATPSMSPFTEQLRTAAAGFAGETGLTLDDLGFVSDNPSSVEAIKASHENLRLAGRKAQRSLGSGLLNVAFIAVCLRDNVPYLRSQFNKMKPKWEPLFEADASTLSLIGDGAIKLNQAVPGYITGEFIRDFTGLSGDE